MAKRALCVGINDYPGTESDLAGCVNDAKAWEAALRSRGFTTRTLLDAQATKAAMVEALRELIAGAEPGDTAAFTYSGHGSWLPDDSSDEADSRDEMLCPHDVAEGAYLLDDELHRIFSSKKDGVRIVFLSDSCHSGTVFKFAPSFGNGRRPRVRFLPPSRFARTEADMARLRAATARPTARSKAYPALLFAGCTDLQFSYDAWFGDTPHGAFTYFALSELAKSPGSPRAWMDGIRNHLPTPQYPQSPQLRGSKADRQGPMF